MKVLSSFFLYSLLLCSFTLRAQSPATGSIDAVFDVSDLGAASYSIPIKVPDGVAGLQPSISLVYNSQSGNGIMGMGWTLSGLSAITRMGNNIYHDKKVSGVTLGSGDRFALDGNRLMVLTGSYGAANSSYGTEIESFVSIKANGTLGTGPQSFTVTDQDGKVFEYGASTNSRATIAGKTEPYMWMLEKITDLNGNYIKYNYQKTTSNDLLIESIIYNRNNGFPFVVDQSMVAFAYSSRTDPNFLYLSGETTGATVKLDQIQVFHTSFTSQVYRTYELEYANNFYTHLIKIKETGQLNQEEFPPTEFTYGSTASAYTSNQVGTSGWWVDDEFVVGDFNGDGKSDLIHYSKNYNSSSNIWNLYVSSGSGFSLVQTGNLPPTPSAYDENENVIPRDYRSSFFDFNGDGKEDFVFRSKDPIGGGGLETNYYSIMLSNGAGLENLSGTIYPSLDDIYI